MVHLFSELCRINYVLSSLSHFSEIISVAKYSGANSRFWEFIKIYWVLEVWVLLSAIGLKINQGFPGVKSFVKLILKGRQVIKLIWLASNRQSATIGNVYHSKYLCLPRPEKSKNALLVTRGVSLKSVTVCETM